MPLSDGQTHTSARATNELHNQTNRCGATLEREQKKNVGSTTPTKKKHDTRNGKQKQTKKNERKNKEPNEGTNHC